MKPKPEAIYRETTINAELPHLNGVRQTFNKNLWLGWIEYAEKFRNKSTKSIFECGIINWQRSCTKIIGK